MTLEQNIFERAKVDWHKLLTYGFKKSGSEWVYCKTFMNGEFKAVVKINKSGYVSGDVFEIDSDDVYFPLRVESMAQGFAGEVRTEYESILKDIKKNCCLINCFIYEQTNRLTSKIYERYGDNPCFPWEKYSGCGVFKNPDNNKWYALVMNIDKSKLDEKRSGEVEIMNIKLSKDKITNLVKQQGFYPAYHMNKKNWITIILNNTLSDDFLLELVEESHNFTLRNNSKNKTGKDI